MLNKCEFSLDNQRWRKLSNTVANSQLRGTWLQFRMNNESYAFHGVGCHSTVDV
jgi:hypothetical protein